MLFFQDLFIILFTNEVFFFLFPNYKDYPRNDILTELNHINDVVCVVTIDMTTPEF